MENNRKNDPDFSKADKDLRQGNLQKDQQKQQENLKDEDNHSESNANFDIAQRRHQAKPRSYTSSVDSENIENQNTEADKEQTDRAEGEFGYDSVDGKKLGDKVSERQQAMDQKNPQDKGNIKKER